MILFSQAPADIKYILSLYNTYEGEYKIKIIVVNVENNYKFFNNLSLNAQIEFVPLIGQEKILKFLLFSIELRLIYKKLFGKIKKAQVYFFSKNYDYVTAFFVERLSFNHFIYFCDIYHIDGEEIENGKSKLKKIIIKLLFGIKIKFFNLTGLTAYQYDFDKIRIREVAFVADELSFRKFKYNINTQSNQRKNMIFFESNGDESSDFINYSKTISAFMKKMSQKYNIYIKPHPRLGYSKVLDDFDINIIDDYIPSELVSLDGFDLVSGVDSTSIATAVHNNVISIIDLFEFKDDERKAYLKNYLEKLSANKIKFIKKIEEI